MKKLHTLVAIVATLFVFGAKAQSQDTVKILPPFKGLEEAFVMKFYRVNYNKVYQVTSVSTSGINGYYPVDYKIIDRDTVNKLYTDTISKGLQAITEATSFDVKIELYLMDQVTLVANSAITTVTVQPIPLQPKISVLSAVNNNRVYVNLGLKFNVATRLSAFTVTNPLDTLNIPFPRKSWLLTNTSMTSFMDSSYKTIADVWMRYQITDTIKNSLTAKTKWVFVPGYTKQDIADIAISNHIDSTTSILELDGWCITKNLPASIKIVLGSGDTTYLSLPASNGLSYWSAVIMNRVPGKTYTIIAYVNNAKGKNVSNTVVHQMGSNPQVVTITSLTAYSSEYELVVNFSYSLPTGKTGDVAISYTKDTDPNFDQPEKGSSFYGLTGSGSKDCIFTNLTTGKYLVRCELNDGERLVTKIIPFTMHALSVNKVTVNPIIVYPNPAKDVIHSDQPITLFNSLGQEVGSGTEIFIDDLPRGLYFYYSTLNQNIISGKVMLE